MCGLTKTKPPESPHAEALGRLLSVTPSATRDTGGQLQRAHKSAPSRHGVAVPNCVTSAPMPSRKRLRADAAHPRTGPTPEQLFVDASQTLDSILQTGDIQKEQCQRLWTDTYNKYREQDSTACKPEDTKTEVAMLFYVVMYGLQTVSHSHYCGTLQKTLLGCVHKFYGSRECQSIERKLRGSVNQYSTEMVAWMEEYFISKESLTKEIDDVLWEKAAAAEIGPKKKKNTRSAKNWFTEGTFKYKDYDSDTYKEQKLYLIASGLLGDFVKADTKKQWIMNLFSGIPMPKSDIIVWKGTEGELAYFFRTLNTKKLIIYFEDHLWDIVASHFKVETQYGEKVRRININPESLSHHSEKPNDANKKKLDNIINYFSFDVTGYLNERDYEKEQEKERYDNMARKDYGYNH